MLNTKQFSNLHKAENIISKLPLNIIGKLPLNEEMTNDLTVWITLTFCAISNHLQLQCFHSIQTLY